MGVRGGKKILKIVHYWMLPVHKSVEESIFIVVVSVCIEIFVRISQ